MASEITEFGKEFLKLVVQPKISFSLWVVCLIVLLIPLPAFLHLDTIRNDFGHLFGLVFLFTFVLWVAEMSIICGKQIRLHFEVRREEKKVLEYLSTLTSKEAHLLVVAVTKSIQTVSWRAGSSEASSLIHKGLIVSVPDKGAYSNSYTVPHFVWKAIHHTHQLEKLKELDKESTVSKNG